MSEPIWPVPQGSAQDRMPTFMGCSRYDWSAAPDALIDFFGMRVARDGWDAERRALDEDIARISLEHPVEAELIARTRTN